MADRDKSAGKTRAQAEREKRLAEALRANLRRRKAAAKPVASADDGAPPPESAPTPGKP